MDDDLVKRLRRKVRLNADDTYASQFDEDLDELLASVERLSAEKEQTETLVKIQQGQNENLLARIAALESGQPVEVRGEMWQLVPVEPTDFMRHAAINAPAYGHPETASLSFSAKWKCALTASAQEAVAYSIHDWPEDENHENGNYHNKCDVCGEMFIGHKRRHVCKRCAQEAKT